MKRKVIGYLKALYNAPRAVLGRVQEDVKGDIWRLRSVVSIARDSVLTSRGHCSVNQ